MMNRCAVCKENYSSIWAKREHDASMIHHVRLQQATTDCEHVCRICKFFCKELSEYSKHIDSSLHKDKLAEVRTRRAVFEDISDDFAIPTYEDLVMDRKPQSELEGVKYRAERTAFNRRPKERGEDRDADYRDPFARVMNPHHRGNWCDQGSAYAFAHGDACYNELCPSRQPYYQPPPVEYSVPIQLADFHGRGSYRESRYYGGAFRRGTPRPTNSDCCGVSWTSEDELMETNTDQAASYSQSSSPSLRSKRVPSSTERQASRRNKSDSCDGAPSKSQQTNSVNSEVAASQTSVPVKKGILERLSLRSRSKKKETVPSITKSGTPKSVKSSKKKTKRSQKKTAAQSKKKQSTSGESAIGKGDSNASSSFSKKASPNNAAVVAACKNSSKRTRKSAGVQLSLASIKTDRTSKWEKVAMKSRALFLKNRSQKMLKERLNKYRLVSPRGDPVTSSEVRMLGVSRRSSGMRLNDLHHDQNGAKPCANGASTVSANEVNSTSEAEQKHELACDASMRTPAVISSANPNDVSFTPFFESADWKRVVKEVNDASSIKPPNSSCFSSSTPVAPIPAKPATQNFVSSPNTANIRQQPPVASSTGLLCEAYDSNTVSLSTNVEVGNKNPPSEAFCDAMVKVKIEDDEEVPTMVSPPFRVSSNDAVGNQSIGTPEMSIGHPSNPNFSSMDDEAKLKHMWSLVAKETTLQTSVNVIEEKLLKLQTEMMSLLNERSKLEKEITDVRETKNRLLRSAGAY